MTKDEIESSGTSEVVGLQEKKEERVVGGSGVGCRKMSRANFSDRERGREIYRVREMGVMVPEKKKQ